MPHEVDDAADRVFTDRIRSILSELDEADSERLDPPTHVWEAIEASIASGGATSPKEPPSREHAERIIVEYWIDADDVVIDVGPSWADFATDNDAPELADLTPGRALWTYFDGDEVRELWQRVVQRVRGLQKAAEVPIRCDAPGVRRWFDVTITPQPDDTVRFRCALVFEEARPPVSLLDPHSERDTDLQPVPLCGWCGRGQHGARWLDVEELVRAARLLERTSMPPISHGICASCRDEMAAELLVPGEARRSSP